MNTPLAWKQLAPLATAVLLAGVITAVRSGKKREAPAVNDSVPVRSAETNSGTVAVSGDKLREVMQSGRWGEFRRTLYLETGASDELKSMIDDAFGSTDGLKEKLAERGAGHFASGWVWLAVKGGKLSIEETHDGDTLADQGEFNPLLVIDLWEHAYYLDHQNARPAYLDAVNGKLNWKFASENLARGTTWKYPG